MRIIAVLISGFCGLIALFSQFPASWAGALFLPDALKQDVTLSGTVWDGRMSGLNGFGPVQFKVFPSKFFGNAPMVEFYSQVPGLQISGSGRTGQISDVHAQGRISTFSNLDGRLAGLAGQFNLQLNSLTFEQGCTQASGTASTDVLSVNRALWQWQGPELSGPISCENGEVVLRLSGQQGRQSVSMSVRSALAGIYTADMQIETDEPIAASVLPLYGFERRGDAYVLQETGTWN